MIMGLTMPPDHGASHGVNNELLHLSVASCPKGHSVANKVSNRELIHHFLFFIVLTSFIYYQYNYAVLSFIGI